MKQSLIDAIACPKCFGKLNYNEKSQQLICSQDSLVYTIQDGIPVLLESEAKYSSTLASLRSDDNSLDTLKESQ